MRPLDGIKILDLTHAVAGPFCTYQLGLLGAEVIKVERPGEGDAIRNYTEHGGFPHMAAPFIALNAGKRSITLNLKHDCAHEILHRLVEDADVVIENFRPGVARKLGLDWRSLSEIKPGLIYCSISGFGQTGPLRDWAAYDNVVQAASGIMVANADRDGSPLTVGFPVVDVAAGFSAAYAIVAAVAQQAREAGEPQGQYIDVAMLDATMVLMTPIVATNMMGGPTTFSDRNAGYRQVVTSGTYETSDGHISVAANHNEQIQKLCDVLRVPELLHDPRFADHASRLANGGALQAILAELFATRSADELERELTAMQVPAGKVRSLKQIIDHPHSAERGLLHYTRVPGQPERGGVVGAPFKLARDGWRPPEAAPGIGEHTADILAELGYEPDRIDQLKTAGAT